ncbi:MULTISPECIES: DUF726 domain-containing protein [Spirulina sp. CCY15215]|uniref:DUF726 domain-containing protein n=1 Tax=Spirulina sp. CCY15215 TaxID=2767591 RepID=UPI00194DFA70|nr:DUF726 domain-containing protein [Spirulina major]
MEKPYLTPIAPSLGNPEALIFIDGSLSEGINNPHDNPHNNPNNSQWWQVIRQAGWQGSIYALWWDRSNFSPSLEHLTQLETDAIVYWHKHKNYIRRVGKSYLPKIISENALTSVSLMGFSIGARVAYYTMRDWSEAQIQLHNVLLLGGTIRRDAVRNWASAASRIEGKLINIYNCEDLVLTRFCQILEWDRSPCGIKPISEKHEKIINFDATPWMKTAKYSPSNYLSVFQELVKQGYWQ